MKSKTTYVDKWMAELVVDRDQYSLKLTVARDEMKRCEEKLKDIDRGISVLAALEVVDV